MNYTFDGPNEIITPTDAPVGGSVDVDVQDLYSRWVDWLLTSDNSKYQQAMRVVGGDPLPGSKQLGLTYFLLNGWKIRPYEAEHIFNLDGNLYSEDGTSPYIPTVGVYNVTIINSVSNLVDSTVQQLPEIENSVYNGGVTIDTVSGTDGTSYPIGTPGHPCKTVANALAISVERGFSTLYVIGDVTLASSLIPAYTGGFITGYGHISTNIVVDGVVFTKMIFTECSVSGLFGTGSDAAFKNCIIKDTEALVCDAHFSALGGVIKIGNSTVPSYFVDCTSLDVDGSTTTIDFDSHNTEVSFNRFSGSIIIKNMSHASLGTSTINMVAGKVTIDSTCSTGEIHIKGNCEVVDNSAGTVVTYATGTAPSKEEIADEVMTRGLLKKSEFIALK